MADGTAMELGTIGGVRTAWVPGAGPALATEQDALDLVGALYGTEADLLVIPAARLAPDFFRLRTGLAGAFLQKLTNYRLRVAIVGDFEAMVAASDALRDFVRESNRGRSVLFARDADALAGLLDPAKGPR